MDSKIKVLYVEDDKQWQDIVRDAMSSPEYELDVALTSQEAVKKLKRRTYHVALLDKRLDEQDPENNLGMSIAHVIAGLNEGTKIIVYTSYGNIDDARDAFRNIKVWDFIEKKKHITEIINAIKKAGEDALLEFSRPTRMPVDILSVKGGVLEQFLSKLSIDRQDLEILAKQLLGKLRPLLPDNSEAKLPEESKSPILQVRYWSKMLGAAIVVWFGKYSDLKTFVERVNSNPDLKKSLGIKDQIDEVMKRDGSPVLGGAVFVLMDADLDDFASQMNITN